MAAKPTALDRLRDLCSALPGVVEVRSHGEPTFRVNGRMFATFASASTHHGNCRNAAWIRSTHVAQSLLVKERPERLFVPPYVGVTGWVGIWLDGRVPWRMVRELLTAAHHLAATHKRGRKA